MSILIVIPARGGSKRLPRKNKLKIHGKPLFMYSVEAAKNLCMNPRVIVSTDDKEIQNICKANNIEVLERIKLLALDYSAKQDVIVDVCDELWEKEFFIPKVVISLQANSPQITTDILQRSINLFYESKGKNGWKEVICIDNDGIQNGSIRIMTYRSVYQKTLSTYLSTFTKNMVDIHTVNDLKDAEYLLNK